MYIEYMEIKDKKEAEKVLDISANIQPSEKDELYIVKEENEYQAVIKIKRFRKKYREQKWLLCLEDRGITAKRERTGGFYIEWMINIFSVLLIAVFTTVSFFHSQMRASWLWLAFVAFFIFLYTTWKCFFKPSVSLKIFLIRII